MAGRSANILFTLWRHIRTVIMWENRDSNIAWEECGAGQVYRHSPFLIICYYRGTGRFSPRADCNVVLRAWERTFDHAYLANWPRMECQLMPVVSIAPPDTCLQSGYSEYFRACTRAARSREEPPFFPLLFWTREELVAPRTLARNLPFFPPFLNSFGFFCIMHKKVFWSRVGRLNPMVLVAPLKWWQSG
jgi:hypothetical protein